jgi:IS30 family transposase
MSDTDELAELIRNHTAARGVDVWAVNVRGYSAAEWADMTGRDRSTVARNVRRAQRNNEMSQNTQPDDAPTATEFIPAEEVPGPNRTGKPMARILQSTGDKGVEVAAHEPYDDDVENHVCICDQCGHEESTEDAIGHHLTTEHET